jgi:serine/threonine-protein kinase
MGENNLHAHLQLGLGSAYTLERELGGGGMSRVYLAQETALGRPVVVKVLAPELGEGLSAERFAREVRLAARLQHPNIVPVLTAGDTNGVPYYTMPFVGGESLRTRIEQRGALPEVEAVAILRDLARALAYAHEQGVVHRDVKPENVLLSGDAAVVTDFGIAKAVDAARAVPSTTALTQLGMAIGTPAYMAPEQVSGETVDHRADLYAWGVVAYELLSGRHPFASKKNAQALFAAHLVEMPPPLDGARAGLSSGLVTLVTRCLAKDPSHRPPNARELVEALANLALISGAAAASAPSALPSIAVLPFVNVGADPENEYFSDGISEEVLSVLAQNPRLHVAARSASFAFKGRQSDLRTIAEQLHVTLVLEGSVRRAGNRVRIAAQLVNVADGYHVWSERYDREMNDIFAVQDEIATSIAATLDQRLRGNAETSGEDAKTESHRRTRQRVGVEAYDEYLKGRFYNRNLRGQGHEPGPAHFRRALELEPTFAAAHAGLAESHLWLAFSGTISPSEAFSTVRRHARRALALDPELPDGHWLLAEVSVWNDWDVDVAEEYIRSALALDENHAEATMSRAMCLMVRCRFEEALLAATSAVQADPVSGGTRAWFVATAFNVGAFQIAIEHADRLASEHPEFSEVVRWRALSHLMLGNLAQAQADIARARSLVAALPANIWGERTGAVIAAQAGDIAEARKVLDGFLERSAHEWISPMMIAQVHQALGEYDAAFQWYERAYQARDHLLVVLHTDRSFQLSPPGAADITADPRWKDLIRRIGIAPSPDAARS